MIIKFTVLTTPSDEDSSNPRKAGIAAGGVVLMSKGNQSLLEGEFLWTDGDECLPPLVPSRGLPRRTLRAATINCKKTLIPWFLNDVNSVRRNTGQLHYVIMCGLSLRRTSNSASAAVEKKNNFTLTFYEEIFIGYFFRNTVQCKKKTDKLGKKYTLIKWVNKEYKMSVIKSLELAEYTHALLRKDLFISFI